MTTVHLNRQLQRIAPIASLTFVLCMLQHLVPHQVMAAPADTTATSELTLLRDGMAAEDHKRKDDAVAKYMAAYAASQGDLGLKEDDRLAIERKYAWALLTDPAKYHKDLLERILVLGISRAKAGASVG